MIDRTTPNNREPDGRLRLVRADGAEVAGPSRNTHRDRPDPLRGFPHGLRCIAEAVGGGSDGADLAMRVAEAYGGSRVYIPRRVEDSKLAGLVGLELARKLSEELGDTRIEIPQAKKLRFAWMRRKGQSQEYCANVLCVARRTIQKWDGELAKAKQGR